MYFFDLPPRCSWLCSSAHQCSKCFVLVGFCPSITFLLVQVWGQQVFPRPSYEILKSLPFWLLFGSKTTEKFICSLWHMSLCISFGLLPRLFIDKYSGTFPRFDIGILSRLPHLEEFCISGGEIENIEETLTQEAPPSGPFSEAFFLANTIAAENCGQRSLLLRSCTPLYRYVVCRVKVVH